LCINLINGQPARTKCLILSLVMWDIMNYSCRAYQSTICCYWKTLVETRTFVVYSPPSILSFSISRDRPKSATLHTSVSLTKIFRAARSYTEYNQPTDFYFRRHNEAYKNVINKKRRQLKVCPFLWDPFPWDLGAQNLLISKLAQYVLTMKISSQSAYNFLSYPAHEPDLIAYLLTMSGIMVSNLNSAVLKDYILHI